MRSNHGRHAGHSSCPPRAAMAGTLAQWLPPTAIRRLWLSMPSILHLPGKLDSLDWSYLEMRIEVRAAVRTVIAPARSHTSQGVRHPFALQASFRFDIASCIEAAVQRACAGRCMRVLGVLGVLVGSHFLCFCRQCSHTCPLSVRLDL
mgnify:CR=1 FL=1